MDKVCLFNMKGYHQYEAFYIYILGNTFLDEKL